MLKTRLPLAPVEKVRNILKKVDVFSHISTEYLNVGGANET